MIPGLNGNGKRQGLPGIRAHSQHSGQCQARELRLLLFVQHQSPKDAKSLATNFLHGVREIISFMGKPTGYIHQRLVWGSWDFFFLCRIYSKSSILHWRHRWIMGMTIFQVCMWPLIWLRVHLSMQLQHITKGCHVTRVLCLTLTSSITWTTYVLYFYFTLSPLGKETSSAA